jgi:hypothetical protein
MNIVRLIFVPKQEKLEKLKLSVKDKWVYFSDKEPWETIAFTLGRYRML